MIILKCIIIAIKCYLLINTSKKILNSNLNELLYNYIKFSLFIYIKLQIIFQGSNEHTFTRSELKLFDLNKTEDIINDLKSDTTYSIGVLLIMEDGNYDNQSIVFAQFKTTCKSKYFL